MPLYQDIETLKQKLGGAYASVLVILHERQRERERLAMEAKIKAKKEAEDKAQKEAEAEEKAREEAEAAAKKEADEARQEGAAAASGGSPPAPPPDEPHHEGGHAPLRAGRRRNDGGRLAYSEGSELENGRGVREGSARTACMARCPLHCTARASTWAADSLRDPSLEEEAKSLGEAATESKIRVHIFRLGENWRGTERKKKCGTAQYSVMPSPHRHSQNSCSRGWSWKHGKRGGSSIVLQKAWEGTSDVSGAPHTSDESNAGWMKEWRKLGTSGT
ncbi:predicted protein [Verticillium alfalfae VaMs.102]|uniref:Predicted protein n=1 Tax=Verticillium alfalfae (strain VaMs.102 / ATCC MYA-4576 / FGSC 10136) TaxID=526221 RepID=C9S9Z4_VERA1|nr:predicted protein [Verticillium alfalfae VaMs.102]EEY16207.1 predicted protein [Verticillium alfalfae VaMs.102]